MHSLQLPFEKKQTPRAASVFTGERIPRTSCLILLSAVGIGLISTGLILLDRSLTHKIFPNTMVDAVDVSGKTYEEAQELLAQTHTTAEERPITLRVDDFSIASSSAQLGLRKNTDYILEVALLNGKDPSFVKRLWNVTRSLFVETELSSSYVFDQEKITEFITALNTTITIPGKDPSVSLEYSNNPQSLTVFAGTIGREIETEATQERLLQAIESETYLADAKVASTSSELTQDESILFRAFAEQFVGKTIQLTYTKDTTITLSDRDIVSLLEYPNQFNGEKLATFTSEWAAQLYREPTDAVFEFNPETLAVTSFSPHQEGRELNTEETTALVLKTLERLPTADEPTQTVLLPISTISANYPLSKTNALGITERIGFGQSYYGGSIPSRINNVGVTSNKITNTIVAPGETFSFNKTLGEISARTGFQPAYVIANGRTELGDGGGVCQVSSTLFRSLLDSGLDITLRLPHSYRVGYYELNSDPGFDATVYSGNVDLRFRNDTDSHVLIHSRNNKEDLHLVVELYGTSDGRTTEITDYQKWGASPPLPTQYIEDPTLPAGTRKQIDWAVSGLKTKFTHTVRSKDGEILKETTYTSTYRPWSAKYLVGTRQ